MTLEPVTPLPPPDRTEEYRRFARTAVVAARAEILRFNELRLSPDTELGDELVVSQRGHHGDAAHSIDAAPFRAIANQAEAWFGRDNLLVATEEGTLHITEVRSGTVGIFADPLDGSTLARLGFPVWSSVVIVCVWSSRRSAWQFVAAAVASAIGWVQTVTRWRDYRIGDVDRPADQDRYAPLSLNSLSSLCGVASDVKQLPTFAEVAASIGASRAVNIGGTPTAWPLLHGELAAEVKFHPSMPIDAAHLLMLLAGDGHVIDLESGRAFSFHDFAGLMASDPLGDVIPPYAAGRSEPAVQRVVDAVRSSIRPAS